MKVHTSNISIFMGDTTKNQRDQKIEESSKQNKSSTIFAGDLNVQQDKIAQKRQEAQQKAMKVVGDAFDSEVKIDNDLEERRNRIDSLRTEIGKAQEGLSQLEDSKNELKDTYGITEDSQEQTDLDLLEKRRDSLKANSTITLTEEDNNRLAELDRIGKTEYQQRSLEIDASGSPYRKVIEENKQSIEVENKTIEAIKQGRLKTHPIVDAENAADVIMDAANKEVVGMLMEEAKDHIDEKLEETQEEADKKAKEEEKQKEQLEAAKKKKEETEALTNNNSTDSSSEETSVTKESVEQIIEIDSIKKDIQKEVQDIVDKMKLVAEDIKGAAVDMKI